MRILFNNVLIKPDPNNKIVMATGLELFLDTRFEEFLSAPQSGVVVQLPERLKFSDKPDDTDSLEFLTTMELQVGDRVIFNYNAYDYAKRTGAFVDGNMFVRYDSIYVAIRDEKIICLNGSVVVEPLPEEVKTKLIVPEYLKNKKLKVKGTVLHASELPHGKIRRHPEVNTMACPMVMTESGFEELGRYVMPGDEVLFHYSNSIPLQHYHELNGTLSRKLLYRMQHTDIEMVTKQLEECRI